MRMCRNDASSFVFELNISRLLIFVCRRTLLRVASISLLMSFFFAVRIFGKPTLAHTFPLLKKFEYAPKRTASYHTQRRG